MDWAYGPIGGIRAVELGGFLYFAYAADVYDSGSANYQRALVVEQRYPGSLDLPVTGGVWSVIGWEFNVGSVTGAVVVGSSIYIFGDNSGGGYAAPPVVAFDTVGLTFDEDTQGVPDPVGRTGYGGPSSYGVAAVNSKIYVVGGLPVASEVGSNVVFEYDTTKAKGSRFREVAPLPPTSVNVNGGRYALVAAASGGKVYAIGGTVSSLVYAENTVQVFTPPVGPTDTGNWTLGQPMSQPRVDMGVTVSTSTGKIYVVGGTQTDVNTYNTSPVGLAEEYTP
jgi:hypothetical protein